MITTRDVDLEEDDSKKRLNQKTTKEIEVKYLGEGEELKPASGPMITTHNIEEFQEKAKVKERMAKARKAKKGKKK